MKRIHYPVLALPVIVIGIVLLVVARPDLSLATESQSMAITVRTNSSQTVGYYGLAQVACKGDEGLTGGGYYSGQWHELLSVYRNGPSADGKKWLVEMMYVAPHYYGMAPSFTVYALCAKNLQ